VRLSLAEVARFTGSASVVPDQIVSEFSIDSRSVGGGLFIALRGDNHDGHNFLAEVAAKGAAAALVDGRGWTATIPLISVPDTLRAMQDLARGVRARLGMTILAITGSAGKTSTKETVAAMLAARYRVAKNEGNLNNHIGVPLSLLRLDDAAQIGVLEMGMNHAGEIALLASIAKPSIGIVTNVGAAHIEHFSGIDGIAAAKRELIEALPGDGTAILNADDARVRAFASAHPGRSILYGFAEDADVRAVDAEIHAGGAAFTVEGTRFTTSLVGRHGVSNVLAGVAAGLLFGIPLAALADAAAQLRPAKMRGERLVHEGITIWNDCYNSNPEAAKAMIDTLLLAPGGRKIAVLGEMLEMGEWAEKLHRDVGAYAARADVVIGIRGAAAHLVDAARDAGLRGEALFFDDPAEAGAAARAIARPGDVVLFKGSRGTRVEIALERFMAN
jgi:UDP-N-acetylmuramoyl-tripeptide--D-alanyl-D-alanine ligase